MINSTTPLIPAAKLPTLDPEKAKKAEEIKAVLNNALQTIKNSKTDYKAQAKAEATARIARVKEQLKMLRQMAGMDPKMVARVAAQLAKELASAVKAYKAAGGTDAAVSSAPSAPVASAAAPEAAKAPDAEVNIEAGSEPVVNTAIPAETAKAAQSYEKTQNQAIDPDGKSEEKAKDRAFLKDAREILEELKGWIKTQRARLKKSHLPDMMNQDMKDIRAAEKAFAETEKDMQKIAFSGAA
jgi:hypothetical protein